ncbi:HNH endonuclease [Aeromonas lusitana]|uniref:HNH endonuclease n=2 Tax=Aeromonas lusitana TaxID=931529 RepID=A0A2M8HAQ9_9GAMM|nr:HNH endonuclease [Aeromonas lusitana]
MEMRSKALNGTHFVKKHYYTALANQFGRTDKAFEYRMQNISYICCLMGRTWVPGLKPAKNVGPQNAPILERLICEWEGQPYTGRAEFEHKVMAYQAKPAALPAGTQEPKLRYGAATHFARDPQVKAWVLRAAASLCECCDKPAPFITAMGEPFLEVHHLRTLADGGSDTISNTVALCPNCHRALHYGADKLERREAIYHKLPRLVRE